MDRIKVEQIIADFLDRKGPLDTLDDSEATFYENFSLLPINSFAAGKNEHFQHTGTATLIAPTFQASPAGGGISITTQTGSPASGDESRLWPLAQSAWSMNIKPVATGQRTIFDYNVRVGASIAATGIRAGLKLTDTAVIATDADQALFVFDTSDTANFGPAGVGTFTASANWVCMVSIAGDDVAFDTGVPVAANTDYWLNIRLNASGQAEFRINDSLKYTSGVLTATAALLPAPLQVVTRTTAAKVHGIRDCRKTRTYV